MAAIGLLAAAGEALLFDLDLKDLLSGGLLATVVFAAIHYFSDAGKHLPHGVPTPAPAHVEVEALKFDRSSLLGIAAVIAVAVALAGIFDVDDDGLLPGLVFGYAVANAVALARVSRWERANRYRVVYDPSAKRPRPYAASPR
jgi:hypothetical protein